MGSKCVAVNCPATEREPRYASVEIRRAEVPEPPGPRGPGGGTVHRHQPRFRVFDRQGRYHPRLRAAAAVHDPHRGTVPHAERAQPRGPASPIRGLSTATRPLLPAVCAAHRAACRPEKEERSEKEDRGEEGGSGSASDPWQSQYAFTLEPFERPDFEVINWHIATHPRSPFSHRPYAQRVTSDRHLLLDGTHLTETHADGTVTERELTEEAEARRVLAEEFDIAVPEGTILLS